MDDKWFVEEAKIETTMTFYGETLPYEQNAYNLEELS